MGRDDDFRCRWLKHPLRNFQRGSTWRSNYDPLTAPNRVVDDLQFLPRISVESIVNRNSGTIGILKGCCSTRMSTFSAWTGYSRGWKEKRRASIPYVHRITRTSPPSPKRYPAARRRCGVRTESTGLTTAKPRIP